MLARLDCWISFFLLVFNSTYNLDSFKRWVNRHWEMRLSRWHKYLRFNLLCGIFRRDRPSYVFCNLYGTNYAWGDYSKEWSLLFRIRIQKLTSLAQSSSFSKYTYLSFLQGATLYEFDEWRRTISKRMAVSSVYKGLPDGIEAAINDYHWVPEYQYIYFFKGQKWVSRWRFFNGRVRFLSFNSTFVLFSAIYIRRRHNDRLVTTLLYQAKSSTF